jgi:hypothetical protein
MNLMKATWRVAAVFLGLLALLTAAQTPAEATAPTEAGGHWMYITTLTGVRTAGCNTFLTFTEQDHLTGTFEGSSNPAETGGTVVAHCSGMFTFKGTLTFDEITVEGRTGGLVMKVNGQLPDVESEWTGTWVIVSATGGLEGLHGQGSWWGPRAGGPGLPGDLDYDGNVHFDPAA